MTAFYSNNLSLNFLVTIQHPLECTKKAASRAELPVEGNMR
jgi:hypothetical protein